MLRNILAAIVGYFVMVVGVMAGIGVAWAILGGQGAFAGEGPHPSGLWITINVVLGFLTAMLGGWVALKLGRSYGAVKILIGIILALGIGLALAAHFSTEEIPTAEKPVAEMSFFEAGHYAVPPAWYNWVIPIVGAVGVCLGGRDRSPSATAA